MVNGLQVSQLTVHEVEDKFGLRAESNPEFMSELRVSLLNLSDYHQQMLDQAQASFKYLMTYPVHEELVKMVVLSPLLSVAGFYERPFRTVAESSVELAIASDDEIVRGRADILVLSEQIWTTVIETKGPHLGWYAGLPQTLVYMSSGTQPAQTRYGLITNGSDFVFIKLDKETSRYSIGEPFSLFRQGNDLCEIASILKALGSLTAQQ